MISKRRTMPIWVAGVLLFLVQSAQAQPLKLSITDAIELARRNNIEIKLIQSEVDKMQADKNMTLAAFLPQLTISETFIKTNDPLNSFGIKLKRRSVTLMDFNPALLNNPADIENYNTKFEVKQPLINIDFFFGRAVASDGLTAMEFKRERTGKFTDFIVRVNYFQVVFIEKSLDVVNKAIETANANNKLIKDYFDEGLITKADLLKAEVFVSDLESKKAEVLNSLETEKNNLKYNLGIEYETDVQLIDSLRMSESGEISYNIHDVLANRSDFKAYEHRVSAMDKMSSMYWSKLLPRLNAFASYDFNDSKAFGTNAESWMFGLNLQWNIFDGFQNIAGIQKSKAELNHAELEFEKAKKEGIIEIENAVGELNTMRKRLKLSAKSVEQSEESLRIIKDRYSKGLEKTADLLTAETEFSNARLKYLETLFQYNISIHKIELLLEKKLI
jgi:outer membrane protein TolC